MYDTLLLVHSWIRWIAIAAAFAAVFTVFGETARPGTTGRSDRWGLLLMVALDIQMLIGLVLYLAVSPTMETIRQNFGAAMETPVLRFWAVEHIGAMLAAVVLVHLGRALATGARTASARRTRLLLCFGAALVAMLAATPWPGTSAGRPLFRL